MPSTAAQEKLQQMLAAAEKKNAGTKARTTAAGGPAAAKKVEKNYDIENNTFAKIIFSDMDADDKKEAVAKALVFDVDQPKEENQKRLKEFEIFKEYLQSERKRMAQDIISLTDTEAFSEMHDMFNEMNSAILEFDSSMKPLTDILDAVYRLRMEGKEMTLDVFKEIQEDRGAEEARKNEVAAREAALQELKGNIKTETLEMERLSRDKKFFGKWGGIKEESQQQIDKLTLEQEENKKSLAAQTTDLEDLKKKPVTETRFAGFEQEKAKLRELLDISSDEHKERQKRLIAAAQNFVDTTSTRGESVLEHFGEMGEHIDTLSDANRGIQSIYAIVTDASTRAAKLNKGERDKLAVPEEGESTIGKMQRENKKVDIEEHIKTADASAVETIKTFADLTEQGSRIMTMKDANREQVSKARELTSSGVAGVAEGLSSVLTIVSAAALNESAELARNSVAIMEERTDLQSQQEALRQAAGISDQADSLNRAVDSLNAYRETAKVVADTTRENLKVVKDAQTGLRDLIEQTKTQIDEQRSVAADAEMQSGGGASGSFNDAANDDEKKATTAKKPAPGKQGLAASKITQFGRQ